MNNTTITCPHGQKRQSERRDNLQSYFEQAVEFVRQSLVNALPIMDMEHAETVLALHNCAGYRQAYEHVLTVH